MFEEHRAHQAEKHYQEALAAWQHHVDDYRQLVDAARSFGGEATSELILAPGETVFLTVTGTELIEPRKGAGSWQGRSQGVSIPIATIGGRSVRYRVGASKGHYVQGAEQPTVVDRGTLYISSARVVFQGASRTRQCDLGKLVAVDHDPATGTMTLSVANRETPTVVRYGPELAEVVKFRLDLALAHHNGTVDAFVGALEADLAALEASPPAAPAGIEPDQPATATTVPGPATVPADLPDPVPAVRPPDPVPAVGPTEPAPVAAASAVSTAPAAVDPQTAPAPVIPPAPAPATPATPAGWYDDPWRRAPLRWWDGSAWTGQTAGT
jgi:hypothetical protein